MDTELLVVTCDNLEEVMLEFPAAARTYEEVLA